MLVAVRLKFLPAAKINPVLTNCPNEIGPSDLNHGQSSYIDVL
jgi:hypothetical protein